MTEKVNRPSQDILKDSSHVQFPTRPEFRNFVPWCTTLEFDTHPVLVQSIRSSEYAEGVNQRISVNIGQYASSRHRDNCQDTFYAPGTNSVFGESERYRPRDRAKKPLSPEEFFNPTTEQIKAKGALYIVADGVSHCADGRLASQLAVSSFLKAYYTHPDTTLEDALVSAHERLLSADTWRRTGLYCWRDEKHGNGSVLRYDNDTFPDASELTDCTCPECGGSLAAAQTTLVAALTRSDTQAVELIGVGDSFIFDEKSEGLPRKRGKFLGYPGLDTTRDVFQLKLPSSDKIYLCADGLYDLYEEDELTAEQAARTRLEFAQMLAEMTRSPHALGQTMTALHSRATSTSSNLIKDDVTLLAIDLRNRSHVGAKVSGRKAPRREELQELEAHVQEHRPDEATEQQELTSQEVWKKAAEACVDALEAYLDRLDESAPKKELEEAMVTILASYRNVLLDRNKLPKEVKSHPDITYFINGNNLHYRDVKSEYGTRDWMTEQADLIDDLDTLIGEYADNQAVNEA